MILSLEVEGRELTSLGEIGSMAEISPGFARKLAHVLVRKGWLERVRRGTYLLNPSRHGPDALPDADPFRVGRLLVDPYYFGYATAAELRNLLPQASRTYYLVSTSRRVSARAARGRLRWIRVTPERFFGTQRLIRRGLQLVVSDLERTVLDCVNRPEFAGGMAGVSHILAVAKPRLNWARLRAHLDRFGNRSLTLRVGYLVEHVRPSILPPEGWLLRRTPVRADSFVPLGPPGIHGRRGPRDLRWHVIRNVSEAQLFAEGEVHCGETAGNSATGHGARSVRRGATRAQGI